MTSLHVICGLAPPPNQKSWLRLCYSLHVHLKRKLCCCFYAIFLFQASMLWYEVHSISFQTFFVRALLLTVHTKNSSPLQSILLRHQCTCCTVPTTSGKPPGSLLVWACLGPSSQPFSCPRLWNKDWLWGFPWALGIAKSRREQGLGCREDGEPSWCPSGSNSLWRGWSCGLGHCPDGNATDLIRRVLASSDGISSWTPLKLQYSSPCWLWFQWELSECRLCPCCQKKGSSWVSGWTCSVWPSWVWEIQHASTGNSVSGS